MQKLKTKNGLIAYKVKALELMKLGGLCICDECNEFSLNDGYLVPVLNHWMCEKCYNDFSERAVHYSEDDYIEDCNAKYYEKIIGLEE